MKPTANWSTLKDTGSYHRRILLNTLKVGFVVWQQSGEEETFLKKASTVLLTLAGRAQLGQGDYTEM